MVLTILISKGEQKLIGQVKEVRSVITEGWTKEELLENIQDAFELIMDDVGIKDISGFTFVEETVDDTN